MHIDDGMKCQRKLYLRCVNVLVTISFTSKHLRPSQKLDDGPWSSRPEQTMMNGSSSVLLRVSCSQRSRRDKSCAPPKKDSVRL